MKDIRKEIGKIDANLVASMLEFAAHAVNNLESINQASELMEIDEKDGEIFAKMLVELGIIGNTSVYSDADFNKAKEKL